MRVHSFESAAFRRKFHYAGSDLGAVWSPSRTKFRVWAPLADEVQVVLYKAGLGGSPAGLWSLKRSAQGTWVRAVEGDWSGVYFTYRVRHGAEVHEAVDPYAKAVGANGQRAMVVNLAKTNPPGWARDRKPPFKRPTDAVIYELHVRDATIHPSAGAKHQGRFLGLAERGLPHGAGLDHLKELGITHLHLLPVFDYASVDETKPGKPQYNWGYDPQNYNVPEGSYATDAADGAVRIREFKQLVQALHRAGIRVVMDVVYNHTYRGGDSHFHRIVPGYYHRQDAKGAFSNGSGCGNEVASDRSMVRKMMVDSLVYWAREYHIDGFRFDLMGLHDLETMKAIRRALDRVDKSILLYGEGWTGGDSPLPFKKRAMKTNVRALDRVAAFSDAIRDGIKGTVMDHAKGGFVQGEPGFEETIKAGVVAQVRHPQVAYPKGDAWRGPWAGEPWRCVTYNSCHDNHALWDKLALTAKDAPESARVRMNQLAAAIVLTSQGISFLHAGEEFARGKKGVENSYNKPDSVNAIDWRRKKKFAGLYAHYRGLVALRKATPEFRLASAAEIRTRLTFLPGAPAGVVAFLIAGPRRNLVVVYNANRAAVPFHLPDAKWSVLVEGDRAGTRPLRRVAGGVIDVAPISALVAVEGE
ncbi:MAG TPA: type I pullulanase [Kiritimatiellia bacterium]|nr:type I pullulanase [Kiritimatiellia bacterium]